MTPAISDYLGELAGGAADTLLEAMERRAAETDFPIVGRATGRWLAHLTRLVSGRRVFEFGSGYGYSAYFFADAVGEGGEVLGSDDAPELVDAHRTLWAGHPYLPRVELRLGRGADVLAGAEGTFDVFLIDSTKIEYGADFEAALARLRPGGLVLVDNVLWGGRVVARSDDPTTQAIQRFNRTTFADPRLEVCILPVGDGLAVVRKR